MSANPVAWFEIYVQDMARAKAFYEAVFQVTLSPLAPPDGELEMWSFPSDLGAYGCGGALVRMEHVPSGGSGTLVYFHSQDCLTEEARIPAAGGTVERPRFPIGEHGFITLARDTEGNLFGLHCPA